MKKIALLFIMLFGCGLLFAQQPQIVLTDFEGTHLTGLTYSKWSYDYAVDTVANPVTDGINPSDSCVLFPAHWFESQWGWVPGFQNFKNLDSSLIVDHNYFYFEVLIVQDTVFTDDTISYALKFEGPGGQKETTESIEVPVWPGGENKWQAISFPYGDFLTITNPHTVCLLSGSAENVIAAYYDNFGFTNTAVGIADRYIEPDFGVSMLDRQLRIFMDRPTYVKDIQIYDIRGSLVLTKSMNTLAKDLSIPVNLQSGVYVVRLRSNDRSYTKKFVNF